VNLLSSSLRQLAVAWVLISIKYLDDKNRGKPKMARRATAEDEVIGRTVRAARMSRGLSQQDLAKMLGISYQQLQKYETGQNRISAGRINKVCEALAISPLTLLTQDNPRQQTASLSDSALRIGINADKLPESLQAVVLRLVVDLVDAARSDGTRSEAGKAPSIS
jgi:transcriptional regulator with XRE-family HTH domain